MKINFATINFSQLVKWLVILFITIMVFIWGKSCSRPSPPLPAKIVSVTRDSIIRKDSIIYSYVPTPYKQISHDTVKVPGESTYLPIDSFPLSIRSILRDYSSTKYYKDSLKTKYGTAYLDDTLQYNNIQGKSLRLDLSIPEYTNTITVETPQKLKNIGFLGFEAIGNQSTPFYMAGATLGIINKKRRYYEIGALVDKEGQIWYKAGYKIPIKFKK